MSNLELIAENVIAGRMDVNAAYPPDRKGQPGVSELIQQALDEDVEPKEILEKGLIAGMNVVGARFKKNECFVPEVLISARAMKAGMELLRPALIQEGIKPCGTFVIGTVLGDLHDIGKNLVSMMIRGGGFEVIDLGVDVPTNKFLDAIDQHPGCFVGLSALLTTTMRNMESSVKGIKEKYPDTKVLVGGAPITQDFCTRIGADFYSPNPHEAVEYLNKSV